MLIYMILLGVLAVIIYLIQFREYSQSHSEAGETDMPVPVGFRWRTNLSVPEKQEV